MSRPVYRGTPACSRRCVPCEVRCAIVSAVRDREWQALLPALLPAQEAQRPGLAADRAAATTQWAAIAQVAEHVQNDLPPPVVHRSTRGGHQTSASARVHSAGQPPAGRNEAAQRGSAAQPSAKARPFHQSGIQTSSGEPGRSDVGERNPQDCCLRSSRSLLG